MESRITDVINRIIQGAAAFETKCVNDYRKSSAAMRTARLHKKASCGRTTALGSVRWPAKCDGLAAGIFFLKNSVIDYRYGSLPTASCSIMVKKYCLII